MKIGFIGLGNMGGPMARNLLKAGHQLTVSDLSQSAVAGLVEAGATAAASIAELASSDVEMIITMLPAAPHVKGVYLGEDGLLRSEEHTSELQSRPHLVCRLLLEKKK